MRYLLTFLFCASLISIQAQVQADKKEIPFLPNELWWGGRVNQGDVMPYQVGYKTNLLGNNEGNQWQPLLISSKGRSIWSEKPFAFEIGKDKIVVSEIWGEIMVDSSLFSASAIHRGPSEPPAAIHSGRLKSPAIDNVTNIGTLKSGYLNASHKYFPFTGTTPDELLFSRPQYNTWIELTYNQNQADVLKYAKAIIDNGMPAGVLMIDDTWQNGYGDWEFNCRKFNDPKAMMDTLHRMGFKVMLWVTPFVSMDIPAYRALRNQGAFIRKSKALNGLPIEGDAMPTDWWNGVSAVLDFTNPVAVKWFKERLDYLQSAYGVDGFKFDAGDPNFYTGNVVAAKPILSNDHSELYAKFGEQYPLNEFRSCWKMGGHPLAQRLKDKNHQWSDLKKLIPHMTTQGLLGYPYACPDMIGGGEWTSFLDLSKVDQDLIVRSAQIHALMPMMQFSLAPWRVLDPVHLNAVKAAVATRMKYTPEIMKVLGNTKTSGEPIMRNMEYNYPNSGYGDIKDQFFLGDKILVAPIADKNTSTRTVKLPKGIWKDDQGKSFTGPTTIQTEVPIDRIPIYELQE